MKISVLVPVYKTPKFLKDIAFKILANDYADKELIAVIDGELSPEIESALKELPPSIKTFFLDEHLGKAEALNRAAKTLQTDILLFLDNDVVLSEDPRFLTVLSQEMARFDIVEMPKEVLVESFYSAMISYEYQTLAIINITFSAFAKRSPGIIGSAFAVKKELFDQLKGFNKVVHEDGDFAARAFRLKAQYKYEKRLKVQTSMPNTLKEWITQRKRWTLINVLWFKENFLHLIGSAFKQPTLIPALLVLVLPTLVAWGLFVLLNQLNLTYISPLIFMVGQPLQFASGIFLWFTHNTLISQGVTSILLGFATTTLMYFIFSLSTKTRFNLWSFTAYYFFYVPLLIIINLIMFITQIRATRVKLDWKI